MIGPRSQNRWRAGVTLIELLVALVISALVVALATRFFLSGQKAFMLRLEESERLQVAFRLKGEMRKLWKSEVLRCGLGKVWLRAEDGDKEMGDLLKSKFGALASTEFKCLEVAASDISLSKWREGSQPQLLDYRLQLKFRKGGFGLSGSILK